MRTSLLIAVALLLSTGCVHTLPEPVVTNVAYDDKGTLVVTKCPVHWTNYLFVAATSVEMTPHLSTDYRPTECHYEHLTPPPSGQTAQQPR